ANEAIGCGDHPAHSRSAATPGHRPALAVPQRTIDHIIPVAQGSDARDVVVGKSLAWDGADIVSGVTADKAICLGDSAADPLTGAAPGPRPAVTVPVRASDHVITVGQEDNAAHESEAR